MSQLRAAHDQFGGLHEIAQFKQVTGYTEIRIVLLNFRLQQLDPVQRAFEALEA